MAIPNVVINKDESGIVGAIDTPDGIFGLVFEVGYDERARGGTTNTKAGTHGVGFSVLSLSALSTALEVTLHVPTGTALTNYNNLEAQVRDFYRNAPDGTRLYIIVLQSNYLANDATKYDEEREIANIFAISSASIMNRFVELAGGNMSAIGVIYNDYNPTPHASSSAQGLLKDKDTTYFLRGGGVAGIGNVNDFCNNRNAKGGLVAFYQITENQDTQGVAEFDLKLLNASNVCAINTVLGNSNTDVRPCIGLALGVASRNSVQVNIGRVSDGSVIGGTNAYFNIIEDQHDVARDGATILVDDHSDLYNGYFDGARIGLLTRDRKAGYFWSGDSTCQLASDGINRINRHRALNKAGRIARDILLDYINSDIPLTGSGAPQPSWVAGVTGRISVSLLEMVNRGEISLFTVTVPTGQNILTDNSVELNVSITPIGTAETVNLNIRETVSA